MFPLSIKKNNLLSKILKKEEKLEKIEFLTKIEANEEVEKSTDGLGIDVDMGFWIKALIYLAKKYKISWIVDFGYNIKGSIYNKGNYSKEFEFAFDKSDWNKPVLKILDKIKFQEVKI